MNRIIKIPKDPAEEESIRSMYVTIEKLSREYMIAAEAQHIASERLAECFRTEGVNQFVNCRELAKKYAALVDDKYHGMLFPPGTEIGINRKRNIYNTD